MNKIYLDNAATSPMDSTVIEAMTASMTEIYGNPSSSHQFGRAAKSKIERTRKNIAKLLNVTPSEIVFTAGGSEADNMILRNAVCHLGIKRIISSKIEHHAVLHTLDVLEEDEGLIVDYVSVLEDGSIDMNHFEQLISDTTHKTLVSLMFINNEIGTVLEAKRISVLCKENDALFHSDAVQVIGHYNLDLQEIPIDFIVASAHKFHGPKGVGFAYFRKGFGIKPLLTGGSQERGSRAGTENVHGIVGMDAALSLVYKNIDEESKYIDSIKDYFLQQLKNEIPGVQFNGSPENKDKSNYCLLNVRFPGKNDMLLFSLDIKGIAASGGSACQSGATGGSHVLNAILSKKEAMKTSIRFSFSKYNNKEEIDEVIITLKEILKV